MFRIFTPYDVEKDLTRAYNDCVASLANDTDFAIFVDGDAIFTTTYFGHQIQEIIQKDVRFFTAVTNRINNDYQKVPAGISAGNDMRKHRIVGKKLAEAYGSTLIDVTTKAPCSGFFIAIRKDLWKQIGGFKPWYKDNKMLGVDSRLHLEVSKVDKVYLAPGLYLWHWYHGESYNERTTDHLK